MTGAAAAVYPAKAGFVPRSELRMSIVVLLFLGKLVAVLIPVFLAFWKAQKILDTRKRKEAARAALDLLISSIPDLWFAVEQEKRRDPSSSAAHAPLARAMALADDVTGGWLKQNPDAQKLVEMKLRAQHEMMLHAPARPH